MAYSPFIREQRSAFGEVLMAQLSPILQQSFEYTVDNTRLCAHTAVGSGTVTQASAMAVVGTGTTTASTALLRTVRPCKYRAGLGGLQRLTALFTSPVAGTNQLIGLADEAGASPSTCPFKNGLMIGYMGTTFGIHRMVNDSLSSVAIASWDDPLGGSGVSGMTITLTNLNVYFIRFQYLGAGAIQVSVERDGSSNRPGEVLEAHLIDYANSATTPSSFMPNYYPTIWVDNGATTSDVIVKTGSWAFFIEGPANEHEMFSHQPLFGTGTQQATSVTTEVPVVSIRGRASYASKTNFIQVALETITTSIESSAANNLASVRLVLNPSSLTNASWSDINTTDSVIEMDTSATALSGGTTLLTVPLAGKNDKYIELVDSLGLLIGPGDIVTLAATSTNSSTVDCSMSWREMV